MSSTKLKPEEAYDEWVHRLVDVALSATSAVPNVPIPQQVHLECHIEVTLEQLLLRLGLSPKARVTITPATVDWAAVGRAGELELDLTDTITVSWEDHREVAR